MQPPESMEVREVWLRRARTGDAADLFTAYASDPVATRYLSWPPRRSEREVEEWLEPRVAGWCDGREFRWVIADAPDGAAFGTVSLRRTGRGFDLGYALSRSRSGQGLATAVVARVLRWVDGCTGPGVVTARTDPDNVASVRVLQRVGFRQVRRETASWRRPSFGDELRDSLVFERPNAGSPPVRRPAPET